MSFKSEFHAKIYYKLPIIQGKSLYIITIQCPTIRRSDLENFISKPTSDDGAGHV